MQPRIVLLEEKKLVGTHFTMSLDNNSTFELWKGFRPKAQEIENRVSSDFISMQIYGPSYFLNFNPTNQFVKWAAVEVFNCHTVPDGLESFTLPSGEYAVFFYKGSSTDKSIFQYIFTEWLPNNSEYQLDDRPHFELLGRNYKNNDPNSEEEIWIPVQKK